VLVRPGVQLEAPTDNLSDLVHKMDIDTDSHNVTKEPGAYSASDDDPDSLQGDGEDADERRAGR
jgi:hypothetical protein